MALQAGVQTSKILILVGAGFIRSVMFSSGLLSYLIAQLQEWQKGEDEAEISPGRFDTTVIAAKILQLAQGIRGLTLSNLVTIFNGNSSSNGSFASYILPAAAIGAMGYCYMWWKGRNLELVESKQTGLKSSQTVKLANHSTKALEGKPSLKGMQFNSLLKQHTQLRSQPQTQRKVVSVLPTRKAPS